MCGICGIINFNGEPAEESSLRKMMTAMKHRGPDDDGIFIEDAIGLGFVRLSIIDLSSAGHQPMISSDGRYVIVYNGEIFNYLELKELLQQKGYIFKTRTDTEVLLASYKEWGEECLHKFNGMWAFLIYDRISKQILCARDRFGIKPFYYYIEQDRLIISSEIQSILKIARKRPGPNYQIIYDFLVFNRTDQTEYTFFAGIKKLQHGSKLMISDCRLSSKKYNTIGIANESLQIGDYNLVLSKWYNLRERISENEGFKNPDEFKQMFSSSIGLRLRSDVPVGVCLSGGLDSSSIVSVLLDDYKKNDLNTFSAVYQKGQTGDESEFINEYKDEISQMYFTTPSAETLFRDIPDFIKAHGEPIPTTSPYAQFKVMELAKRNVVVTLDGQGADEELAGYHYFFGFYFKELLTHFKWNSLLKEINAYYKNHKSVFGLGTFGYFLLTSHLKNKVRVAERGYINPDFVKQYAHSNSITAGLYSSGSLHNALIDHFEYKLEHLLKWEDRNSMWFSLEARVPFLDYRLVEKTLALSPEQIINRGMTKFILREAMKGTLPEKIRVRKDKVGFETPQSEWFREPIFQKFISDILQSESFRSRKIIMPAKAERIYKKHLSGMNESSREIWKWINLELWFREFID